MNQKSLRGQPGVPTIADVAARAGFSLMTVSRVINGEKNVRESTRDAVLEAIRALNYSPNQAARTLAGADPIRIGLLYSNPSAAYLSRYLLGSLEQARLSHVQLLIEKCDSDPAEEEAAVHELIASGVDGIILPPPMCDSPRILALLEAAPVLSVIVANWRPDAAVSVVRIDDKEAAAAMTRHIIALGHERIGFIVGDPTHKASGQREQGFRAAMREAGLTVPGAYVTPGAFTYRSGLVAAGHLLDLPERPTAIFASNDDMAAATVAVAHRRFLDVPTDLTVCGFDDTDFAQSIWPELTTIHQPIAQMSKTAIEMLTEQIKARRAGKIEPVREVVLDFTLVSRESAAPPAA
ncbi:LacI family transcriptional regulator [Sphingomonas sp. HMWF008]|nr:LacI family transcriptional regulator [Sphingomonas sp. HMWF008]